ncbi:hypothetical protein TrVE_jg367 [Triparma verrucosa]|uniref:Uncharacterized protein n=1 Tax=Triparma verrucosa TaxID=1606542 RepID=A0A9W6Z8F4_9STRA|nr:hypothetical protein TrVE_jg367 [Triparma verrucosa]
MSKWLNSISSTLDNLDSGLESTVAELGSRLDVRLDNNDSGEVAGDGFEKVEEEGVAVDGGLKRRYNSLVEELKGADKRNADLARELNQLNKSFLTLQQTTSSKDIEISNLSNQVTSLKSTLAAKTAQHANVDVITETLQSEVHSLRTSNSELQAQATSLSSSLSSLRKEKESDLLDFERRLHASASEILSLKKSKNLLLKIRKL